MFPNVDPDVSFDKEGQGRKTDQNGRLSSFAVLASRPARGRHRARPSHPLRIRYSADETVAIVPSQPHNRAKRRRNCRLPSISSNEIIEEVAQGGFVGVELPILLQSDPPAQFGNSRAQTLRPIGHSARCSHGTHVRRVKSSPNIHRQKSLSSKRFRQKTKPIFEGDDF